MGIYDLGLSSEQFWSITPAQLYALFDRKKMELFREDWRSGIICSTLANINRTKGSAQFKPTQFMPESDIVDNSSEEMEPDELLAAFERAFAGKIQDGGKQNKG